MSSLCFMTKYERVFKDCTILKMEVNKNIFRFSYAVEIKGVIKGYGELNLIIPTYYSSNRERKMYRGIIEAISKCRKYKGVNQ